jgi:hypothetical protein
MKHWLITMIVLLLSVQTAVAAVCQYCEHVEHATGVHAPAAPLDAHADAHPDTPLDAFVDAQDDSVQTFEAETCVVCHLSSASVPTDPGSLLAPLQANQPPPDRAITYNPSHIERIQHVPLPLPASS